MVRSFCFAAGDRSFQTGDCPVSHSQASTGRLESSARRQRYRGHKRHSVSSILVMEGGLAEIEYSSSIS